MGNPIVNVFRDETFEEKKAAYFSDAGFPARLRHFSKLLADRQFFCGTTPTYCDFSVFHILDNSLALNPAALDAYPNMRAYFDRVSGLPAIAQYLQERPDAVDIGT